MIYQQMQTTLLSAMQMILLSADDTFLFSAVLDITTSSFDLNNDFENQEYRCSIENEF